MRTAMPAVPKDELVVVALEGERFRHLLVAEGPVAERVVQVVVAILQEDADGLLLLTADHKRVVVAALDTGSATRQVGIAADPGEDLAELVGALPGDCERADRAGAEARDGAAAGVMAELVG